MLFSLLQKYPMSPTSIPNRRGRPGKHPIDQLRTKFWFHAVKRCSGLSSSYAIEMELDGDRIRKRISDVARPRKWDGYEKGSNVPSDKPGSRNAIEQAEAKFPGTANCFRSPLWAYLRGESFYKETINDELRKLAPEVVSILFEETPREHENQTRPRDIDAETVSQLLAFGNFDALVASVLLVALSDVIASPDLRKMALDLYINLQEPLLQTPDMQLLYAELFSLIDGRCKHWVYISPNQRLDVVITWQGVQQHLSGQSNTSDKIDDDTPEKTNLTD